MTKIEISRRLATLKSEDIARIATMIDQGYGAHGISLETPYSVKQVNAVFASHQGG